MKKQLILIVVVFVTLGTLAQNRTLGREIDKRGEAGGRPTRSSGEGSSILDDSTRMLYGPATTRYLWEKEIIFRLDTPRTQDSSHLNYHETMDPIQELGHTYHDLGNIGTAMNSIHFKIPEEPGARMGVDEFDYYFKFPDEIKYYNTESPHSWFDVIWGGNGRSITRAGYTRNINPRWNIGGDFEGYYIDKQIQRTRRGDRHTESISYDLYTWYNSSNLKYGLLASFVRTNHQNKEIGGVDLDINENEEIFFTPTAPLKLNTLEGVAYRNHFHLFHDYKLNTLFKVFHIFDWGRRINRIELNPNSEDDDYFDVDPLIESGSEAIDQNRFYEFSNKLGIQGNSPNFYYQVNYQLRRFSMVYKWMDADTLGVNESGYEHGLNGELGLKFKKIFKLDAKGKMLISGQHYLNAKLSNNFLEAELTDSKWKPGFTQQAFFGHYDFWINNFDDPWATSLKGRLKLKYKNVSVSPGVELQSIRNHIYYYQLPADTFKTQKILPMQTSQAISGIIGHVKTGIKYKKLNLEAEVYYTLINEDAKDIYPTPDWLINGKISYENSLFDNALQLQMGLQFHWKSDYYAMGYDPLIQQFYSQDNYNIPRYLLASAFLNGKIKRGLVFLKMNNLLQMFSSTGYLTTPYYPGVASVFDFGFKFNFYD